MTQEDDKRKHERFPLREDILIDGSRMCTSMDISEGGIYISAIQSYENDSIVDITIPIKDDKLTVRGRICHCQSGIGMGVKFIDLNDEQMSKIRDLVHRLKDKSTLSTARDKHILLVEDNKTSRQAIKNAISQDGFCIIEANDGIEAMKFIAEKNLDLIILDLNMKGIDGLKVLSVLKANPKWKEIPVIVCSGHDSSDIQEKVLSAGADKFLTKRGTSPSKVANAVKEVLRKYDTHER